MIVYGTPLPFVHRMDGCPVCTQALAAARKAAR